MSLSAIEEKYINLTLADLLEQVLYYKTKIDVTTSGARDKAIWRALYIHSIKTYNRALGTLGLVGTSNLARLQQPYSDRMLREEGIDFVTEADIEHIVTLAYGMNKVQRQANRYEMKKKMAKAFLLGVNSNGPVKAALETLVKHGAIDKLIPMDKLLQVKAPEIPNLPRGNPRKGGIISKFIAKGYNLEEAHRAADKQMYEEEAGVKLYDQEKEEKEFKDKELLDKAIKDAYIAIPKKDLNQKRAEDALAMLNDEEPKAKVESLADLNPFEEGGFK